MGLEGLELVYIGILAHILYNKRGIDRKILMIMNVNNLYVLYLYQLRYYMNVVGCVGDVGDVGISRI
jgi:hypothetical protein